MVPEHLLSWMIFFPLIGAGLILFVPKRYPTLMKVISLAATIPPLWWAGNLYLQFDRWGTEFQYVEKIPWIKAFNIHYFLGIDGFNVRAKDRDQEVEFVTSNVLIDRTAPLKAPRPIDAQHSLGIQRMSQAEFSCKPAVADLDVWRVKLHRDTQQGRQSR